MYYHEETQSELKNLKEVRVHINASFSKNITPEQLLELGIVRVIESYPEIDPNTQEVITGGIVDGERQYTIQALSPDEINIRLDKLKTLKLDEMRNARDDVANGTTEITTSLGNTFIVDANIKNRSTMHQAVTNSVNAGFTDTDSVNWKMGDNKYTLLTYGEMKEIGIQLGVFINTQFQKEAAKMIEVNEATIETIDFITWSN